MTALWGDGDTMRKMARAQAKHAFFDSMKQEAATTQDQLRASVARLDVATQAQGLISNVRMEISG